MIRLSFLFLLAGAVAAAGSPESAGRPDRSIYQLEGAWTDDAGQAFPLERLRGERVVLAMFFTRCPYACPAIVEQMETLQAALSPAIRARTRFVLASFDSERDTPAVLRAYRQRRGLDPGSWVLLHGDADTVRELAMVLGVKYARVAGGGYAHSTLVTVLDGEGRIVFQRPGLDGDLRPLVEAVGRSEP